MRAAVLALVAMAVLLGSTRLFTGLVYGADEPVSYFVLKLRPDAAIERTATAAHPVTEDHILAQDELSLPHAEAYITVMRATPATVGASLLLAVILLAVVGVRRRKRPPVWMA